MIIEIVTVTTTPKSLYDLLVAAGRDPEAERKSESIKSVSFRLPEVSTDVVYCSDKDTVAPVILLDPANAQPYESHLDANLHRTFLSVSAGTSDVGMIVSQ